MNTRLTRRLLLAGAITAGGFAAITGDAHATHGNATYICLGDTPALEVQVPLDSLTEPFDAADFWLSPADYTARPTDPRAHMDRNVPGTVGTSFQAPVDTTTAYGRYSSVVDGALAVTADGPVPIFVTGTLPVCTATTTTIPSTSPAASTTVPPMVPPSSTPTTGPGESTTTTQPPASSTVPPAPPSTLPSTGNDDHHTEVKLELMIVCVCGGLYLLLLARRPATARR